MSENTLARQASPSRGLSIALWAVQAVTAVAFVPGGVLKITGDPALVDLFTDIGAGQWLRYLVGVLEVAGGLGLLVPRLNGLAALGLVGLMAGATVTNLFVLDEAPWVPLLYLALAAIVGWGRWPQTRALATRMRR